MWCSVCQFMRQYRNDVNGSSRLERTLMRKSGTPSISPTCIGVPTSPVSQLPQNRNPVNTIEIHQAPVSADTTSRPPWNRIVRRAKRTALRSTSGATLNSASVHSLVRMPGQVAAVEGNGHAHGGADGQQHPLQV